ncbi:hypothetical protein [Mycobacterium sp.]|uniref:hypothetical protein n=1 Tax=Mycobacterium sp. TaxID=1785 RepID=UPI0031DDC45E
MTGLGEPGEVTYVKVVAPSSGVGVSPAAYDLTGTGLGSVWLRAVNIRIPPGHAGMTGIALLDGDQFIVPRGGAPTWIVGDDDDLTFAYDKQVGVNTSLATYNQGTFTHGWQVRLEYTPLSTLGAGAAVLVTPNLGVVLTPAGGGRPRA